MASLAKNAARLLEHKIGDDYYGDDDRVDVDDTTGVIIVITGMAMVWAMFNFYLISLTKVESRDGEDSSELNSKLTSGEIHVETGHVNVNVREKQTAKLLEISGAISEGAKAFLNKEFTYVAIFCLGLAGVIIGLVSWGQRPADGALTALAFVIGASVSMVSGYIGMMVAVYSNVRTTVNAQRKGFEACFNTAFQAGSVMGFALNALGLFVLYVLMCFYSYQYKQANWDILMECISGYGLGGSTVAMFGRVGGGIYTKAADVGADLCGKVIHGIPEDDPRNPAVVADNVGDNVGDVAGMGSDLFGSFAEATCACLVIGSQNPDILSAGWGAVCYPLLVSLAGMVCCFVTYFCIYLFPVNSEERVEHQLRLQLLVSTFLMLPIQRIPLSWLPHKFEIQGIAETRHCTIEDAYTCVVIGCVGGLIIGLITEYFTSKTYSPVLDLVTSTKTGAATNIIYGLALGYYSVIIPIFVLAFIVYVSFERADLYGVSLCACGMLSNIATTLTIDVYGPVTDNAGGIAEMSELPPQVRHKTDALDAAGNTTAAIGKGFAIGSAALVSLALYGAFVVRVQNAAINDNRTLPAREILTPIIFAFLLIGSMIPYWFSALTMKSVGKAAMLMVKEVERQFKETPSLLDKNSDAKPDYAACVGISTEASLREMIAPAALVLLSPLVTGTFFGVQALCALLTGSLCSSVMLAISMSNTGGAWDNAKKYIELSGDAEYGGKGSECHKAAVVGDTVGDPLKDTSGPALNIVMKLMAIVSLVFANYFYRLNHGQGIFQMPDK